MPFIITSQPATADKAVEAILCESNLLGQPDKRRGKPILMRQLSERELVIEPDDRREIISAIHRDGRSTYAIDPSRKDFAAATRLAQLQKLSELLDQAGRILTALEPGKRMLDYHAALLAWAKSPRPPADAPLSQILEEFFRSEQT